MNCCCRPERREGPWFSQVAAKAQIPGSAQMTKRSTIAQRAPPTLNS
jgi:hypothetical protein